MVWITILCILAALIMIGIIIMVHELGHFSTGRWLRFKIDEFAVGFGPKIVKWKSKKYETLYSIRPFPIGGFTRYHGEDKEAVDEDSFSKKPIWKRAVTIFAGPAFNIIFAFVLAVIFLTAFGEDIPKITTVYAGTPAYEAGLKQGDLITSVNGEHIDFQMEGVVAFDSLIKKDAASVKLGVLRQGQELSFDVPFYFDQKAKRMLIGIGWSERAHYSFFEAIGMSFKWIIYIIKQTFVSLGGMITGQVPVSDVMGPVGIISTAAQVFQSGFESVMKFATLISVSLGIMNILPLPALDGGRLVFLGIEKIRRKPLPPEKEGYIHLAGFILLIGLIILLTYQDIARLITGS